MKTKPGVIVGAIVVIIGIVFLIAFFLKQGPQENQTSLETTAQIVQEAPVQKSSLTVAGTGDATAKEATPEMVEERKQEQLLTQVDSFQECFSRFRPPFSR